MEILKELGEELKNDPEYGPSILEPLEIFGLDRFEDSAVIIRARFKTKPFKQWGVKREFYRRMKRVFDERGHRDPVSAPDSLHRRTQAREGASLAHHDR